MHAYCRRLVNTIFLNCADKFTNVSLVCTSIRKKTMQYLRHAIANRNVVLLTKHKLTLVLLILGVTIFYNEFLAYEMESFRWSLKNCENCVKLLLVADPQLLGEKNENYLGAWFARWDSDRYLSNTFSRAVRHSRPHAIAFLGDLMDEGHIATIEEFSKYKKRLDDIFYTKDDILKIYLPGDNDIGGEEDMVSTRIHNRFKFAFTQPDTIAYKSVIFFKVNRLTRTRPNAPKEAFLNDYTERNTTNVILSHMPLLFSPGPFVRNVIKELSPQVIFTAHDHKAKHLSLDTATDQLSDTWILPPRETLLYQLRLDMGDVHELQIPTCSYRMGTPHMGYGLAYIAMPHIRRFESKVVVLDISTSSARLGNELSSYEKNVTKNIYKSNAYRKAANTLSSLPNRVKNGKEAKELPGIGEKIGKKIDEFLKTGKLRKLEIINQDEKNVAINLLTRISGIGPSKAKELVDSGIRSLNDLKRNSEKLNHHQKYFEDFENKIPRDEVMLIENLIRDTLDRLDQKYLMTICGSYRRGKSECGDIDVLITHPNYTSKEKDAKNKSTLLKDVVECLKKEALITDVISQGETKFMGVCRLSGEKIRPYRRLDIRLVPRDQYYCAVLYFTGSDSFNRDMRAKALDKKYTLNEYALRRLTTEGLPGDAEQINSEADIFRFLEMTYKEPQDRNI
ncbi:uncharacterized protein Mppe isoform X2 [Venturia canescens]|uniref:uncharacterized protein Mppe isoform X2 n=1 Tax=Venturia canescens TaxID=32260 RepID=UPI001C9C6357|nr:uncharacterized protein LOC122410283 isoform X2 [Venturia canescens]